MMSGGLPLVSSLSLSCCRDYLQPVNNMSTNFAANLQLGGSELKSAWRRIFPQRSILRMPKNCECRAHAIDKIGFAFCENNDDRKKVREISRKPRKIVLVPNIHYRYHDVSSRMIVHTNIHSEPHNYWKTRLLVWFQTIMTPSMFLSAVYWVFLATSLFNVATAAPFAEDGNDVEVPTLISPFYFRSPFSNSTQAAATAAATSTAVNTNSCRSRCDSDPNDDPCNAASLDIPRFLFAGQSNMHG